MYYKEEWINDKLYWKASPNGEWIEFTKHQYAERLLKAESELKNLQLGVVRQSLQSDVYTELDIDKAYKCGERQSTFYKKNGTVILPRNYEGVDG